MIGASGAISAVIGAYSLSFGRAKRVTRSPRVNRLLNRLWLLAAWVVLQLMIGYLAGQQGMMLATPAHIGGFVAGLLLQRPLLLWRYRGGLRRRGSRSLAVESPLAGSSRRWRWTMTYFISASSTVRWALPRQASSASA